MALIQNLPTIPPNTGEGTLQVRYNNAVNIILAQLNQLAISSSDLTNFVDVQLNTKISTFAINQTGAQIDKYTAVGLDISNGYDVNTGAISIEPLDSLDLVPIGITSEDVADDATTYLLQYETCIFIGFDTTSSAIGNKVFVDTSDGSLSLTGNRSYPVGVVQALDANGVVQLNFAYLLSKFYSQEKLITDTDSPYTCSGFESVIITDSSSNPITINLPSAANLGAFNRLLIKDNGSATTNNITFVGTVEGGTPTSITTNYGSLRIISDGTSLLEIP